MERDEILEVLLSDYLKTRLAHVCHGLLLCGQVNEVTELRYNRLGRTGITVSRLCLGVLTVGPLQANLPIEEGARVIKHALEGV